MKKSISTGLLTILLLTALILSFFGCVSADANHTHTFGEWQVLKNPDCTDTGLQKRSCACGYEEIEVLSSKGHTGEWIIATPAVCEAEGLRYRVCTKCGVTEREEIPPTGHQGEWRVYQPNPCTEFGHKTIHCTACGLDITQGVSPTGHDLSEWQVVKQPSCGIGIRSALCHTCLRSIREGIPADATKPHSYGVDDFCTVCGEHRPTEGLVFSFKDDDQAMLNDYNGTESVIYIPSMYAGAMVTEIAYSTFSDRNITSVSIPNSITTIATGAFRDCIDLVSITIPSSVTYIGSYAFERCRSLTSIELSGGITRIWDSAFKDCSGLQTLTLPGSVNMIGSKAFEGCTSLSTVTIPRGFVSIMLDAFRGCTSLTTICFEGTKEAWSAISKSDDWDIETGDYTIHCTDGDIRKDGD